MTHNERFTRKNYSIWDNIKNEEFYEFHYRYECNDMCRELNKYEDKVNELSDENEQLKKDLKKKFMPFAKADGDYTTVNTEEFIKILNENEQLKKHNKRLHQDLHKINTIARGY